VNAAVRRDCHSAASGGSDRPASGVLTAIAPIIGIPRLASATGKLAEALTAEIDAAMC
jgi:hypothetical protein